MGVLGVYKDSFYRTISISSSIQSSESLEPAVKFVDFPLDGMTFNRPYMANGAKFPGFCSFQGGNSPSILICTCVQGCVPGWTLTPARSPVAS